MKLITPQFESLFTDYPFYSQHGEDDQLVIAVLHTPDYSKVWYFTEYSAESKTAFGYVAGEYGFDLGYFSLHELESLENEDGTGIEQDQFFQPMPFSQVCESLVGGIYA